MKLAFVRKQHETDNVWSFFFEPQSPIVWEPGQYVFCTLRHKNADQRGESRYFTIASAPHERVIRITTRFFAESGSSFKRTLFALEAGALMDAYPPDGSFVVRDVGKKYLFLAGGIGITPFRAIFSHRAHHRTMPDIALVYANQLPHPVFAQEFERYAHDNPLLTLHERIAPDMITQEFIAANIPDYRERVAYISGPEPMVKAIASLVRSMGLEKRSVKTDYFPGYQA